MGLLLSLVVAISVPGRGSEMDVEVPVVAPKLTPRIAPILAPELESGSVPATLSVYDVNLPVEAAITLGSVGLALTVDLFVKPTLEGDVSCRRSIGAGRCDPADLTAFDRYAVGRESRGWTIFSDVVLYTSIVAPVVYLGLESIALPTTEPWGDWAQDLLIVSEAIAFTAMFQVFVKFAFKRPRPVRYGEEVDAEASRFDQELSFPSGHTSVVSAATTALTTTIFLRHPKSKVRYAVLGTGLLLTALTGVARVEGGHHFPSDVIMGALVGGFGGVVIPWLHRKESRMTPTAMFDPVRGSSMFGVTGTF